MVRILGFKTVVRILESVEAARRSYISHAMLSLSNTFHMQCCPYPIHFTCNVVLIQYRKDLNVVTQLSCFGKNLNMNNNERISRIYLHYYRISRIYLHYIQDILDIFSLYTGYLGYICTIYRISRIYLHYIQDI